MTDNWNALTGDEMGEINAAFANKVLKWELARGVYHNEGYLMGCEKSPTGIYWYDFHDQDCIPIKVDEFAPLTDLNHWHMLWLNLTCRQKHEAADALNKIMLEEYIYAHLFNAEDATAKQRCQAIYTVTVGKE